jgi:hypothetical protein
MSQICGGNVTNVLNCFMINLQMIVFVVVLTVTLAAFGASVWVSLKRPSKPKPAPNRATPTTAPLPANARPH